MHERLDGKVALVTGAGRGIGNGVARAYARKGAHVYCSGRTQTDLDTVVQAIRDEGGSAQAIAADVADRASLERLYAAVQAGAGKIDILVVNAGYVPKNQMSAEVDEAEWRYVFEVNLFGSRNCIELAVGSGAGITPIKGLTHYGCSKAALHMLVRILAEELHPKGLSINELIPGAVITERNKGSFASNNPALTANEWIKYPDDVGPLALFLALQPDDGGPTGQMFALNRRPL